MTSVIHSSYIYSILVDDVQPQPHGCGLVLACAVMTISRPGTPASTHDSNSAFLKRATLRVRQWFSFPPPAPISIPTPQRAQLERRPSGTLSALLPVLGMILCLRAHPSRMCSLFNELQKNRRQAQPDKLFLLSCIFLVESQEPSQTIVRHFPS